MDLLQTLLVYMSLVFATSVQTAPEPSVIPDTPDYAAGYMEVTPEPTIAATPVPTINITPNPAYKTLQVGDKGDNVRAMQEKLQELIKEEKFEEAAIVRDQIKAITGGKNMSEKTAE